MSTATESGEDAIAFSDGSDYAVNVELAEALAKELGVSRQTIANIERGNYSPSVHLALDICHELGKTVEEIFGDDQHD